MEHPTGTVTMLFSDVEGSTQLLARLGADRYANVLVQHRRLLREAFARHGGHEVDTAGDSFFVAFNRPIDAASAAAEAQQSLANGTWPDGVTVRVRMAIHTGQPLKVDAAYVGMDVHRAARVMSAAHGGQVLVSETTAPLLDGVALRDLGLHRLKDLLAPIRLYQLVVDGQPEDFPPPRSLFRANLPVAPTPFLGRERELADLDRLLVAADARVVTVTGPGGVGKTRMALQAAADSSDVFPDGVFWVALAPVRHAALLGASVAHALEISEQPDRTVVDSVVAAVARKRALVLLDNCEHLLDPVADLVRQLVESCPQLVVLCSSRERLGLRAERVFPLLPMTGSDAEALFVERARMVEPEFVADEHVAAICAAVDELPLAIELAAARVRSLSTVAIRDRLEKRLPLLASRDRDRDDRQRTLEAAIAWSYDLLTRDEQRALRGVSVFIGGCTLQAAETVVNADLDLLESLLDKSLLRHRVDGAGNDRYSLLETIREYALGRLREAGEWQAIRQAHRAYFVRAGEDLGGDRLVPEPTALASLDADRGNYRVALLDAIAEGDADAALGLVASLAGLWLAEGEIDSHEVITAAIALHGGSRRDRGWALQSAAAFAVDLSRFDEADRLLAEAEAVARELREDALRCRVYLSRSYLRGRLGDYADAARWAELAVRAVPPGAAERVDQRAHLNYLQFLRLAAMSGAEPDVAILEECLTIGEALLDRSKRDPVNAALAHAQLSSICLGLEDLGQALEHGQAELKLRRRTERAGSRQVISAFGYIGVVAGRLGDDSLAVRLGTAWRNAFASEGFALDEEDVRFLADLERKARERLGFDDYAAAVRAGAALTVEDAVGLALAYGDPEHRARSDEPVADRS